MSEQVTETAYSRIKDKWNEWTRGRRDQSRMEPVRDPNRVVVFGTNLSGAAVFSRMLQETLDAQGGEKATVELTKHAGYIDDTFFGKDPSRPKARRTIPSDVVVFPDGGMYQGQDEVARQTRIPMPVDHIENLAETHGARMTFAAEGTTPEGIMGNLGILAARRAMEALPPPSPEQ